MKRKRHILVVSQYFYPENFRINDICKEWIKRGYQVTVVTGIPNYPKGKFFPGYGYFQKRREVWNKIRIIRLPLISRGSSSIRLALNYLSFAVSGFFWAHMTRVKADYVFQFEVSPMTQALIGVWYARKKSVPSYLYVQDLWPDNVIAAAGIKNKLIIKQIDKMVNYIYKKSDMIFATSESFVKTIQRRGVGAEKLKLWQQYAEDFYVPGKGNSELEISRNDKTKIVFTGNIGTTQGLEILPETAKKLKKNNVPVEFIIIGEGRNRDHIIKLCKKSGVYDMFRMLDAKDPKEIPDYLAVCDAAFLSFQNIELYNKTIPAKIQSYLACKMPILAAVEGETAQIVRQAQCGFVSKIGDSQGLYDNIIKFIELSGAEKKQMAENALKYKQDHFDKKRLMDEMDQYFRSR